VIDWDRVVGVPTLEVFGEPVRWVDPKGRPRRFLGVFDNAYRPVMSLGDYADVSIATVAPCLGVQISKCPVPPFQGMQIEIRGRIYSVKIVEDDGHGHAKLLLNLTSFEP
jgi:hypothetical protein